MANFLESNMAHFLQTDVNLLQIALLAKLSPETKTTQTIVEYSSSLK
jgi:hypothetical protein